MKPCIDAVGYTMDNGYVQQSHRGRRTTAQRVAWMREHGPIPVGFDVHHTCGNRRCIEPTHLELVEHDRHPLLHGAGVAVDKVLEFLGLGLSGEEVARRTGVSKSHVSRIKRGWRPRTSGPRRWWMQPNERPE